MLYLAIYIFIRLTNFPQTRHTDNMFWACIRPIP